MVNTESKLYRVLKVPFQAQEPEGDALPVLVPGDEMVLLNVEVLEKE